MATPEPEDGLEPGVVCGVDVEPEVADTDSSGGLLPVVGGRSGVTGRGVLCGCELSVPESTLAGLVAATSTRT